MLKTANLTLRFLCELAALVGLAVWGAQAVDSGPGRVALAVGTPVVAALAWGRWVAPKARRRLADPARAGVELVVFGAATVGLWAADHPAWAILLAVVATATAVGTRVWGELDQPPEGDAGATPSTRSTMP